MINNTTTLLFKRSSTPPPSPPFTPAVMSGSAFCAAKGCKNKKDGVCKSCPLHCDDKSCKRVAHVSARDVRALHAYEIKQAEKNRKKAEADLAKSKEEAKKARAEIRTLKQDKEKERKKAEAEVASLRAATASATMTHTTTSSPPTDTTTSRAPVPPSDGDHADDDDGQDEEDSFVCFQDDCEEDADSCGACPDHCNIGACTLPTHVDARSARAMPRKRTRERAHAPLQVAAAAAAGAATAAKDVPEGPMRAGSLDPGVIWIQVISSWLISPDFAADDLDRVRVALNYIAAAWSQGVTDVFFKYFAADGNGIKRKFIPKPAPDDIDDETFATSRSEAILAVIPSIEKIMVVCRAYARGRMIKKKHTHLAVITDMRSDAFYAIEQAQEEIPKRDIADPVIHEEMWDGPERALWWFLLAASTTVGRVRTVLERAVEAYGHQYRAANGTVFVPIPVWQQKYSPEALRRRAARATPEDSSPPSKRRAVAVAVDDDDDVASAAGAAASTPRTSSAATPTPVRPSPVASSSTTSPDKPPKKGSPAWWKAQRLAGLAPRRKKGKKTEKK